MKKITIFFTFLLISICGFSQELLENGDFETGDSTGWIGNAANVVTEGGNSYNSANVTEAGNPYDVNLSQVESMTSGQTYQLTFDAWSDGNRTMIAGIGLNEAPWTNNTQTINLTSTTQNFSLTLVANFTNTNSRVIFDMGADTGFVGIDNVSLTAVDPSCTDGVQNGDETGVDCGGSCDACSDPAPNNAPSTPPARPSADVISIYGQAYGTPEGLNGVSWDNGSNAVEEEYAGNNVLKITNGTSDFIGFDVANTDGYVDATEMTHIHADFWVAGDYVAGQVLKIKLSNHDDDGEINAIIKEIATSANDAETWVSIDAELGSDARERIAQVLLIYTNSAGAPNVLYTDNIYFHKNTVLSNRDDALFESKIYPNPSSDTWTISTPNNMINSVEVFNVLGKKVISQNFNSDEASISVQSLASGIYLARLTTNAGVKTMKLIRE